MDALDRQGRAPIAVFASTKEISQQDEISTSSIKFRRCPFTLLYVLAYRYHRLVFLCLPSSPKPGTNENQQRIERRCCSSGTDSRGVRSWFWVLVKNMLCVNKKGIGLFQAPDTKYFGVMTYEYQYGTLFNALPAAILRALSNIEMSLPIRSH